MLMYGKNHQNIVNNRVRATLTPLLEAASLSLLFVHPYFP